MGGAVKDHGGDIDRARAAFGGAPEDWLDLKVAYLWGGEEDQDELDVEVGLQR